MYRMIYKHPISNNECSRCFKTLKAAYRHLRKFSTNMTAEIIPIGTSETFYVSYAIYYDCFFMNSNDDETIEFYLKDVKDDE